MNRPKKLLIYATDRATVNLLAAATASWGCTTSTCRTEAELRTILERTTHDFAVVEHSDALRRLIGPDDEEKLAMPLHEVERRHIIRVLAASNGNRTHAARVLSVDPKTLYNKLKRYQAADARARRHSAEPRAESRRSFFD
ncbi:MAG: helix-turn-helix domain-containing protein [Planctomycetota bacterium]